jgi:hypothetical protein
LQPAGFDPAVPRQRGVRQDDVIVRIVGKVPCLARTRLRAVEIDETAGRAPTVTRPGPERLRDMRPGSSTNTRA